MAAANNSEKIDLLVYGPIRPILENGFPEQFVLHKAESRADLERLTPDVLAKIRGIAVTLYSPWPSETQLTPWSAGASALRLDTVTSSATMNAE